MLESEGYQRIPDVYKDHIKFFAGDEKAFVYEISETDKGPKQELKTQVASIASAGRVTSPIVIRDDSMDINLGYKNR